MLLQPYGMVEEVMLTYLHCGFDPLLHLTNTNKNITMGYLVEILNIAVLTALCMYGYLILIVAV